MNQTLSRLRQQGGEGLLADFFLRCRNLHNNNKSRAGQGGGPGSGSCRQAGGAPARHCSPTGGLVGDGVCLPEPLSNDQPVPKCFGVESAFLALCEKKARGEWYRAISPPGVGKA